MIPNDPCLDRQIAALVQQMDDEVKGLAVGFLSNFRKTTTGEHDIVQYTRFLWNPQAEGILEQAVETREATALFTVGTPHLQKIVVGETGTSWVLCETVPDECTSYIADKVDQCFANNQADRVMEWVQAAGYTPPDMPTSAIRSAVENGIQELVQRIQEKARYLKIRFNPPVPEEEVADFEQRHGITLPGGYRFFITHIGDGWTGGHYDTSISQLAEVPSPKKKDLKHPFKFSKWVGLSLEPPESEKNYEERYQKACQRYDAKLARIRLQLKHGILWLEDEHFLVLNGPERGNIWYVSEVDFSDGSACFNAERQAPFLAWYDKYV